MAFTDFVRELDFRSLHVLVYVGLLFLTSQVGGRVAGLLGLPRVTGYLLSGVVFGPSVLGVFREELVEHDLAFFIDVALAVIAFSIGGSLHVAKLRRLGKSIFWITATQAFGALLIVTLVLSAVLGWFEASQGGFWQGVFPTALVLGAISAATAPAPILAITRQYRARGPFTSVLFGVVALDDGLTIVFFAFALSFARALGGDTSIGWHDLVLTPGFELLASLLIGGLMGASMRWFDAFFNGLETALAILLGVILLTSGLALSLGASPLLACMVLGFVVANYVKHRRDAFLVVERIEEPLFGLFFALAGAHFDFSVMHSAGWLVLVLTLARFGGKLLGSYVGARLSEAPQVVRRLLGLALLPQAGVEVGLLLQAKGHLVPNELLHLAVSAMLGAVILNAVISPLAVRFALVRAGEATRL